VALGRDLDATEFGELLKKLELEDLSPEEATAALIEMAACEPKTESTPAAPDPGVAPPEPEPEPEPAAEPEPAPDAPSSSEEDAAVAKGPVVGFDAFMAWWSGSSEGLEVGSLMHRMQVAKEAVYSDVLLAGTRVDQLTTKAASAKTSALEAAEAGATRARNISPTDKQKLMIGGSAVLSVASIVIPGARPVFLATAVRAGAATAVSAGAAAVKCMDNDGDEAGGATVQVNLELVAKVDAGESMEFSAEGFENGTVVVPEGVSAGETFLCQVQLVKVKPEAAAAVVVKAVVKAEEGVPPAGTTISPWLPVGASDRGIKGEKCGSEYLTEGQVQQAFKPGTHIGYYQANGAAQYPLLAALCSHHSRDLQIEIGDIMRVNHAQCPFHALQASTCY